MFWFGLFFFYCFPDSFSQTCFAYVLLGSNTAFLALFKPLRIWLWIFTCYWQCIAWLSNLPKLGSNFWFKVSASTLHSVSTFSLGFNSVWLQWGYCVLATSKHASTESLHVWIFQVQHYGFSVKFHQWVDFFWSSSEIVNKAVCFFRRWQVCVKCIRIPRWCLQLKVSQVIGIPSHLFG